MRIADMNWMQVEAHVKRDHRAVLPIGSTEQHAFLSLSVDSILAERVAVEAAEPLAVPVYPVINYGLTPGFVEFPGTVTLRLSTLAAVVCDILDGIARAGFRRILIVNGHGGNTPVHGAVLEWLDRHRGAQVKWHNWWNAPLTWAKVMEIDKAASHASWMENFPWTRLGNVAMPQQMKPMLDVARYLQVDPAAKRELLGDGNYGGLYQRSDADMLAIWQVAVEETRALLAEGWA
jgi:creatinine amidohydrolase